MPLKYINHIQIQKWIMGQATHTRDRQIKYLKKIIKVIVLRLTSSTKYKSHHRIKTIIGISRIKHYNMVVSLFHKLASQHISPTCITTYT